jgi:hypothetical protein
MKPKVGRTPRSARVPLDPLFLQADEGVGSGPEGPPHLHRVEKRPTMSGRRRDSGWVADDTGKPGS